MYHPRAHPAGSGEFIELHNTQAWSEDLSGYRLSGAVDYVFPPETLLPANGFLVIARSPEEAKTIYNLGTVLGPYDGALSNGGETLRLRNPSGAILLEIPYRDRGAWPVAADGFGHSLVLSCPSHGEGDPSAWSASQNIDGSPGRHHEPDPEPWSPVIINEVKGHPTRPGAGFVELFNRSEGSVTIGGWELSVDRAPGAVIPAGTTLGRGERYVVAAASPELVLHQEPFPLALIDHANRRVQDALCYLPGNADQSWGRVPDGSATWDYLAMHSRGQPNGPAYRPAIIFNEIMFHPISELDGDEYFELHNRGTETVTVGDWKITGGVEFTLPAGATIPAQGYLVVAKDAVLLRSHHPHLNDINTLGNYEGQLSNGGETLRLLRPAAWRYPDELTTVPYIPVDEVTYRDSGRWSQWADGGGSSLELVDPHSDNDLATNWRDSDESEKSSWTTLRTTTDLTSSGAIPRSLQLQLLAAGEMLVDDVELFKPGSRTRVRNGNFESSSNWVFQGNHERSEIVPSGAAGNASRALVVRASGRGDPHSNRIRQTILTGLSVPGQATVRARVRWLRGHPELLFRLAGNSMEAVARASVPENLGTPGQRNSRWRANSAPTITGVTHTPVLPAANQAVSVRATVHDRDGVQEVTLNYRLDLVGHRPVAVAMVDDGTGPDEVAGDGTYAAFIPRQSSGRLVAFTVTARDQHADSPTESSFPEAADRECLVRFGEQVTPAGFGDYRIWMTRATLDRWTETTRTQASNEPLDITFVYNGERVFYNVGATYSGSFFNSPNYTGPTGSPCDYACRFYDDEPFLGASRVILSWPGLTGTPDNTAQHEQFSYWLASQLGLPFNYRRYVSVTVNGVRRGPLMEDTQRPNSEMLAQWFPRSSNGDLFKIQVHYESDDSGNSLATFSEASLEPRRDSRGNLETKSYRWNWAPQALGNSPANLEPIFQLVDTLQTRNEQAYTEAVRSQVNIEQWMRTFAVEHIVGNWDSYGYGNGQNMYAYRPPGDRWQLMMWDLDISTGSGLSDSPTTSLFALSNPFFPVDGDAAVVGRMYRNPDFLRAYWRTLEEAAHGPMTSQRVARYVDPKYAALRRSFGGAIQSPSALKSWVQQRRTYILQQLGQLGSTSFRVLSPARPVTTTNSSPFTITGQAAVGVQVLQVNGVPVTPRWTGVTTWQLSLPLFDRENEIRIEGLDRHGNPVDRASATLSVTFTGGDPGESNLIINEWMARNRSKLADPADGRNEDWLELYNAGEDDVDLAGYTLTDDFNQPTKWSFPANSIIPSGGHLLVWLDGDLDQQDLDLEQWHANFSLDGDGERIALYSPDGVRLDAVEFGPQSSDLSVGRSPNGARTPPVCLERSTPGRANSGPCALRILEIDQRSSESVHLTWRSIPGERYVVERSATMEPGTWQAVSPSITADRYTSEAEVPPLADKEACYFRVSTLGK